MNKNFKVIFNRARGLLVVANECARSVGKSKSIVTSASAVAMCVLVGGVSLSSINPALATESFNQNNLIGNGSPIQISDTDKLGENTKVIGGIDLSGISSSDIANTNVSITLSKETTIDEVIGGSQARTQKEKDKEALLHIGSSTLEAKNITADRIIGGSKNSNSDKVNLSTDKIKTTLSNVIVKEAL